MSVYVGIDVHRKRSHVAVIDQDGGVLANRNAPNGVQPTEGATGTLRGPVSLALRMRPSHQTGLRCRSAK